MSNSAARARRSKPAAERVASVKLCRICMEEPPRVLIAWDSMNGRASNELCWTCAGGAALQPHRRNFAMNDVDTTPEEIVQALPTNKKCATCGQAIPGAHWHFGGSKKMKVPLDKSGRAYFCHRGEDGGPADCCPLPTCVEFREEAADDWDEFEFEDDDEFVFGDDDDDDEFVFGDEDEEDDDDWDF